MKIKAGKLDRIPRLYSDELMHVISAMLSQDPTKRPSAEQLLNHEYISIRIQEKKQFDRYTKLKRKELEYQHKLEQVKPQEMQAEKKLADLAEKEASLQKWALQLDK
jgi:serine/threonine protein kinase